jgi:DNA-binding transcriptional regulator PaaX
MVRKYAKNTAKARGHVPKISAPQIILTALKKLANAPFEVLLEYGRIRNQISASTARTAIHRLQRKQLIHCERRGNKLVFMLTEDGEREAETIKTKLESSKPKKWDGKWRVIVFDVPEKSRGKRDVLRRELVNFGFMQLQKSVWVYPHALPQEFKDLWERTGIYKHCVVFEADVLENEMELKKFFSKGAIFS